MKAERIFRVLGLIDQDLIQDAAPGAVMKRRKAPWWAIAACLALVCTAGVGLVTGGFQGFRFGNASSEGASGGTSQGMGIEPGEPDSGAVFTQYAGPVFPLTTMEPSSGLTAERGVTWDFAPGVYPDGEPRQWGANITDAYILTNPTDQEIRTTALYPFPGKLAELYIQRPSIALDGMEPDTALYAGPYSGGFQSTYGADVPDTMNLDTLDSWIEYKALLDSGEYLSQALGDGPVLDIPVTVYDFTDFAAPLETWQAATQAISFTIDEATTRIFTYGFNGMESKEGGFRRYSYFVPDGMRRESETKLLAVLGDDIQGYELEGYQDGGCEAGEEIDGVSCTVTRTETTLDALLDRLCAAYAQQYGAGRAADQENAFDSFPFAMYRRAVAELLTQYGPLGSEPKDRYDGRLDDILSEALIHERVFYLAFPVTVPAGGSVEVSVCFWKAPSYDFQCDSGSRDLQGYDMVTNLGTTLDIVNQTASLENVETIVIMAQNFGFDLENNVVSVSLDPAEEHYYLEIRPREN